MKTRMMMACCMGLLLLLTFIPTVTHGAVPKQINYQGILTDSNGNPVSDGDYEMSFAIYNAPTGGTELWSEAQTVTVTNGIYNVILGQPGNLLDPDDFDGDLYLGVTVGTDAEMTPRQKITATAFTLKAAKAEDADTLDGKDSVALDQSSHVTRTDNPHSVTATQIGAITIEVDPTVLGSVKDGVSWGELSGIPSGFADGTDDTGITTETDPTVLASVKDGVSWGELSGIPAGFADGVDNVGNLTLPYIGWYTSDQAAFWITNKGVNGTAIWGLSDKDNGIGVLGQTDANIGVGVLGKHQLTGNYAELGVANAAVKAVGFGSSWAGYFSGGLYVSGKVGIGTTTPPAKLSVNTTAEEAGIDARTNSSNAWTPAIYGKNEGGGDGVYGWSQNRYGVVGVSNSTNAAIWGKNHTAGPGIHGEATGSGGVGVLGKGTTGVLAESVGGTAVWAVVSGGYGDGIYAERGPSGGYAAQFKGNVIIKDYSTGATVLELGEGLDYAEGFDVSDVTKIDTGSVLVIDPYNPGKLTLSTTPYDTKVAGIVAGANGMGSGVRLGADQFDYDIALAGRVYCMVDSSNAAVNPGDLLTTSATPGHAMKALDCERTRGAILGKAMQGLEKGKKRKILVLVTLQ